MNSQTITLHRVFPVAPERVYKAFTQPAAWAKWLPPHGYMGEVQHMEARVGGTYHMSFTELGSGHTHGFGGEYLELQANERIIYTATFDDPNLPGRMQTTVSLRPVSCGTEVHIVQEGVPAVIPAEQCYLGWQQSLQLLGLLIAQ